jgi:hypothetical protein
MLTPTFPIICTVYEYPTTNIELYQYKLDKGSEDEATSQIIEVIKDKPWVKAVMMNVTIRDLSMVKFCEDLSHIKEGVGGVRGRRFLRGYAGIYCFCFLFGWRNIDPFCCFCTYRRRGFSIKNLLIG